MLKEQLRNIMEKTLENMDQEWSFKLLKGEKMAEKIMHKGQPITEIILLQIKCQLLALYVTSKAIKNSNALQEIVLARRIKQVIKIKETILKIKNEKEGEVIQEIHLQSKKEK